MFAAQLVVRMTVAVIAVRLIARLVTERSALVPYSLT